MPRPDNHRGSSTLTSVRGREKYNPSELDFGDRHDFFANSITAVVLGIIIGTLFGWQAERVGIFRGCVIWISVFAVIGFRRQIWHLIRFLYRHTLK